MSGRRYFPDHHSRAVAEFLVACIELEAAVKGVLARFYAEPRRRPTFESEFLDRLTLGVAVERLKPVAKLFNDVRDMSAALKHLVALRNAVAHGLPLAIETNAGELIQDRAAYAFVVNAKRAAVLVEDLPYYTAEARALAERLEAVLGDRPPNP